MLSLGNHEAGSGRPVAKEAIAMRAYKTQHSYYCGVDLHARSLFVNGADCAFQLPPGFVVLASHTQNRDTPDE